MVATPPYQGINQEPAWQPARHFTATGLPQEIRYWLLDDGSLTSRLLATNRGDFRVQRLYQGWQLPRASERRLLGLPMRELALIREVILWGGGKSEVFARSVFPLSCLSGKLSHLRRIQSKPLGAILFKNPGMHRSPFELSHLRGHSDYIPAELHQEESAWGRRCCFTIEGKSLMVSEVFLQDFTPWPSMAPVHRAQRGKVSAANMPAKQ